METKPQHSILKSTKFLARAPQFDLALPLYSCANWPAYFLSTHYKMKIPIQVIAKLLLGLNGAMK